LSGIWSFYYIITYSPIATIFISLIDSSVLNLMVLKGVSAKYVTFWLLHGSLQLMIICHYCVILSLMSIPDYACNLGRQGSGRLQEKWTMGWCDGQAGLSELLLGPI